MVSETSKYIPAVKVLLEANSSKDSGLQVWDTDFGMRMCIVICNDILFPEVTQQCASLGADLIIWPAAWKGRSISLMKLTF